MVDDPRIIWKYFPSVDPSTQQRIQALAGFYEKWNRLINVISRQDMDHFYERHVLHSLAIHRVAPFSPGSAVLDAGTGGGFPGIPLAIFHPTCHFTLVDSIGKKITVLQAAKRALALENVTILQSRLEDLSGAFDYVTSRAVSRTSRLLAWTRGLRGRGSGLTYLLLKGGDLGEELAEIDHPVEQWALSDYFEESYFSSKCLLRITL